jgi:drug/metabolite transporter (DMT)-like permease
MPIGVLQALGAAALFGASTPLAKLLAGEIPPLILAGLLYLGSGAGLATWMALRRLHPSLAGRDAPLARQDLPWLAGAVLTGGVLGPSLLMWGLAATPGSTASLLLNLEGVFTALIAWFVFRENFDRRVALGMLFIVVAGALLSWQQATAFGLPWGALAIAAACLCWAVDNNLTRKVSMRDATQIAALKGLVAGSASLGLGLALGGQLPGASHVLCACLVGLLGYGVSLVLFVLALRNLGVARTGAYFSMAPFAGAVLALPLLGETPGPLFWLAALLMGIGIGLHLTERHAHEHRHEEIRHSHRHVHDAQHQHAHEVDWGGEPHTHEHLHEATSHVHAHFPDAHHRHRH